MGWNWGVRHDTVKRLAKRLEEIDGDRPVLVVGWSLGGVYARELAREVPEMVRRHLRTDVDAFLAEQGLTRADIRSWVAHPGGPKVLESSRFEAHKSTLEPGSTEAGSCPGTVTTIEAKQLGSLGRGSML